MKNKQRLLGEVESKRKIATSKRKEEEKAHHHCCYCRYFHQMMHLMFLTEVRERKARSNDELVANAWNILEVLCSKNHFDDYD